MNKAIVVGSINRDVVAYVANHPRPGETVITSRGALFPGGKGVNQAVAIARSGGSVSFVGRIGNDGFGQDMQSFLTAEGIDISNIAVVKGAVTGLALITVDADGQNAITVLSGANQYWGDAVAMPAAMAGDCIVCQLEVPLAVVALAFQHGRTCGARTVLNAAPFQPLCADLLAATDILIVNELELTALSGLKCSLAPVDFGHLNSLTGEVLSRGPDLLVVTLGATGCFVHERGATGVFVPGLPVTAIDTTGAGDCFVGTLVAELLMGRATIAAARFANAAAALSVTRKGAASSLPSRHEVEQFLAAPA